MQMTSEHLAALPAHLPSMSDAMSRPTPVRVYPTIDKLIAVVRGLLIAHDVRHIAPPLGVLDDDADFDMPIDLALIANQLLPLIVEQARLVYSEAWFDKGANRPFPLELQPDIDGLMGLTVVEVANAAELTIAVACITDAIMGFIERSPPQGGVLTMG